VPAVHQLPLQIYEGTPDNKKDVLGIYLQPTQQATSMLSRNSTSLDNSKKEYIRMSKESCGIQQGITATTTTRRLISNEACLLTNKCMCHAIAALEAGKTNS
jgi:hypothetical protein